MFAEFRPNGVETTGHDCEGRCTRLRKFADAGGAALDGTAFVVLIGGFTVGPGLSSECLLAVLCAAALGRYRAKFLDIAWKVVESDSRSDSPLAAPLIREYPLRTSHLDKISLRFQFAPEFDQQLDKTLWLLQGNKCARVVDDCHLCLTAQFRGSSGLRRREFAAIVGGNNENR
jgi:hypothetical protein